jgi:hypothetical protein
VSVLKPRVPGAGFEPALPNGKGLLRSLCLPFHHPGPPSSVALAASIWFSLALRGALGTAVLLMCGGCWRARVDVNVDSIEARLREGDAAYAERTDPLKLDQAISLYLDAQGFDALDTRPMARLARAHYARAVGFPDRNDDDFALAREFAVACLLRDPAIVGRLASEGGRMTPDVVSVVGVGAVDCLTWGALGWAAWLDAVDVAGPAIDRATVVAMGQRAVQLAPAYDRGRPYEALGVALSLSGGPEAPDRDGAIAALRHAASSAPTRLQPRLSLALMETDTAARRSALEEVVATVYSRADPDELENSTARKKAAAALVEVPSQPGAWRYGRSTTKADQP